MKVKKVRSLNAKFPEMASKSLLDVILFCVLKTDLLTSMGTHVHLSERLKKFYTLGYWEGQDSWGTEYLCFEKRLWEIQSMKVIIKEGLGWWFLDRGSRNDIFTTRF